MFDSLYDKLFIPSYARLNERYRNEKYIIGPLWYFQNIKYTNINIIFTNSYRNELTYKIENKIKKYIKKDRKICVFVFNHINTDNFIKSSDYDIWKYYSENIEKHKNIYDKTIIDSIDYHFIIGFKQKRKYNYEIGIYEDKICSNNIKIYNQTDFYDKFIKDNIPLTINTDFDDKEINEFQDENQNIINNNDINDVETSFNDIIPFNFYYFIILILLIIIYKNIYFI